MTKKKSSRSWNKSMSTDITQLFMLSKSDARRKQNEKIKLNVDDEAEKKSVRHWDWEEEAGENDFFSIKKQHWSSDDEENLCNFVVAAHVMPAPGGLWIARRNFRRRTMLDSSEIKIVTATLLQSESSQNDLCLAMKKAGFKSENNMMDFLNLACWRFFVWMLNERYSESFFSPSSAFFPHVNAGHSR